ncbi:MAG: polymer-forming cytoskeletal protein [Spirochaetales bacterium]|nr:polymer-forming cytoskeletal protein [Spirochaetales bacterium]
MALRIDDISINTILGKGTSISGDIKVNGFVRVDGDIKGNLETDSNVIVGENSRIQGNVKSKTIIIGGIILGNVFATDNVKLLSGAVVIGDVISHKVQIEDSAVIHGHCISLKNEELFEKTSNDYLQKKAIKDRILV